MVVLTAPSTVASVVETMVDWLDSKSVDVWVVKSVLWTVSLLAG